jgi:hypothetical protein
MATKARTKSRRESLRDRLRIIERDGLLGGLGGLPVGDWPETRQAKSRMIDGLPNRCDRTYTIGDLIDALYIETASGRYARRES